MHIHNKYFHFFHFAKKICSRQREVCSSQKHPKQKVKLFPRYKILKEKNLETSDNYQISAKIYGFFCSLALQPFYGVNNVENFELLEHFPDFVFV